MNRATDPDSEVGEDATRGASHPASPRGHELTTGASLDPVRRIAAFSPKTSRTWSNTGCARRSKGTTPRSSASQGQATKVATSSAT